MNLHTDLNELKNIVNTEKIVAIIRGVALPDIPETIDALIAGGIKVAEITLNLPDAFDAIAWVVQNRSEEIMIGAGTVTSVDQVEKVQRAGGKFIVSPDTNIEIIEKTKELGLLSMPGAMTPSEINAAWTHGADYVKLFPAGNMGLGYIKAIKGPLPEIPLLVVGGINLDNLQDYFRAGAVGAGIGGNLVDTKMVARKEFAQITSMAKQYCAIAHAV